MMNLIGKKKHILHVKNEISKGIGILIKARNILPLRSLKTLYFSFIYPFLIYCNHVWGSACITTLYPIVIKQKQCMRIITRSKYLEHTNPIFEKLDLLKMSEINKYIIGKFMYRWYHNQLPSIFHNMFVSVTDIHNYNTRQKDHLYTTKIKTCLGQTRITYLGPKIWNDILKAKINPNISEYVFSKSLKKCIKEGIL